MLSSSNPPSPQPVHVFFSPPLGSRTRAQGQVTDHTVTLFAGPWVTSVGGTTGYTPQLAAHALLCRGLPKLARRR
jgi:hypothetical protein